MLNFHVSPPALVNILKYDNNSSGRAVVGKRKGSGV